VIRHAWRVWIAAWRVILHPLVASARYLVSLGRE
jgi:hypothetical protein